MKQGTIASILLFFLGLMVQAAGAADVQINGDVGVSGSVTATFFSGSGSGLTNLDPTKITSGTANINISGNAATATTAATASSVVDSAVTDAGLADGAVTPAKIAFYGKVAIVATSGGNYDSPDFAMSGYGIWCGTPSPTNPCLLKIMPGVYTVFLPVVMQPYIDIEGSGEKTTKITGAINSNALIPDVGTVQGASNAELRFLTVENTGVGTTTAILNSSASPSILHVTAIVSGGANVFGITNNSSSTIMTNVTATASGVNFSYGVFNLNSASIMTNITATGSGGAGSGYGVFNQSSSPIMTNVTASASGATTDNYGVFNAISSSPTMSNMTATASGGTGINYGVYNHSSSATMTNVTAIASGGGASIGVNSVNSGTVKINHSVIKGTTNTINNGTLVTTFVGSSQLDGGAVSNSGTLTCAGVYDENFAFYASTCP